MSVTLPLPKRVYLGVWLVSLATLMYETLLTRVFSVTMWYHFAFVAISLALFGMTVGAVIVYLFPAVFDPSRALSWLARSAALFSITIVLSFLTHLSVPFSIDRSVTGLYSIALTYTSLSVPFIFSGICLCLALTRFPQRVGALYAADLIGAAFGCIAVLAVLEIVDAPTAVFIVALLAVVSALLFAGAAGLRRLPRILVAGGLSLALFSSLNGFLGSYQSAPLRLIWVKGQYEQRPLYEKWNSFSRIAIFGDPEKKTSPGGWGLSDVMPPGQTIGQLAMYIDAGAETVLTEFHGDLTPLAYLRYDITNLVHYIRPNSDVLILGSGGGRDILSALVFQQKSVVGVEINPNINRAVNSVFGEFTGHLDRLPQVTFVDDEARSYIARSNSRYDIIQVSLVDTYAATNSGAFVLTENSLYTVEAWQLFLDHLTPRGVLTFSRWYPIDRPSEVYRLASLASAALIQRGITHTEQHIIIMRYAQQTNGVINPVGIGTILVSSEPFSDADIDTLEAVASRLQFQVVFSPRNALDPNLATIVSGRNLDSVTTQVPINIAPPTDDSPFFFLMLRFQDAIFSYLRAQETETAEVSTITVLAGLFIVVVALTLLSIIVPLHFTTQRTNLRGSAALFVFFGGIGLGYMLVEVSQTQRWIIFLGNPTYSLSVVLFTLLLSSGLGSFFTQRFSLANQPRAALVRLGLLVAALVLFGAFTPLITTAGQAWITPMRILAAGVMLFPIGLFMGMAFPLGMQWAAMHAPTLTPWFWGVNGAASVCASVLAVVVALTAGISAAFWTGVICYLVAMAAFGWTIIRSKTNIKNASLPVLSDGPGGRNICAQAQMPGRQSNLF